MLESLNVLDRLKMFEMNLKKKMNLMKCSKWSKNIQFLKMLWIDSPKNVLDSPKKSENVLGCLKTFQMIYKVSRQSKNVKESESVKKLESVLDSHKKCSRYP